MPSRRLPARPHLDHLKAEAHVRGARGLEDAVRAFLAALEADDRPAAEEVLAAAPEVGSRSLHVAAALGAEEAVRRLISAEPSLASAPAGDPGGQPLLWLSLSPFHGESAARDAGLLACARALLEAGADPNARGGRYDLPPLYGVTGHHQAPAVARLLLEAGANPTDGESLLHAAERFHQSSLELLLEFGADLDAAGDWGNTPLCFQLLARDLWRSEPRRRGFEWLLARGADPDARSGRRRETCLHLAARVGQAPEVVRALLAAGADPDAARADGRTPWALAKRAGHEEVAAVLEAHGVRPAPLAARDALLAACGRGDAAAAARLATPALIAALEAEELALLPEAAASNRPAVVEALLAAGVPASAVDGWGATALHHAAIHGRAEIARGLLRHGADPHVRDAGHHSTALGWALFGADRVAEPDGDYPGTVRALLETGARPAPDAYVPAHPGVREVLRTYGPG